MNFFHCLTQGKCKHRLGLSLQDHGALRLQDQTFPSAGYETCMAVSVSHPSTEPSRISVQAGVNTSWKKRRSIPSQRRHSGTCFEAAKMQSTNHVKRVATGLKI